VGKQPAPSPEELEFIFGCFLRGLSDREVLDEMQDTEYPRRNPRFIRERRRHFDAAKKVFHAQPEIQADSNISRRKEEHFQYLAKMVEALLSDDLDTVERIQSQGNYAQFQYSLGGMGITHEQLGSRVGDKIQTLWEHYPAFDVACLVDHLRAEYQDIDAKGLSAVVRDNPYEFIETLRVLARRQTFKGTCPVCKDW